MDHLSKEKRRALMSSIRGRNTKPEKLVRSLLHQMGIRFRLHRKDLPGTPDIVLPKYQTVIFVHGCFWHRHTGCSQCRFPKTNTAFWEKKLNQNVLRDTEAATALEQMGWRVLIIWECETKNLDILRNTFFEELIGPTITRG
ncbi:MAG: very short patch repair endonuclease [Solidesulfovibrio sp. DCME]|uniref:very short patch repair endonuclease n=1 Tax=Solidesulfovibrio sp. DCME TaxID=3447380 RepID=UPI003D116145